MFGQLTTLEQGGSLWAGLKFVVTHQDLTHTLVIEPLQADNSYVFIDLDTQWPGPVSVDSVHDRASDSLRYLQGAVRTFLDSASGG